MIKRHENDMLFTLFWYEVLKWEGGSGGCPNIWIVWGGKHIKMCQSFMHNQAFRYTCLPVRLVCLYSEWLSFNFAEPRNNKEQNLRGKVKNQGNVFQGQIFPLRSVQQVSTK